MTSPALLWLVPWWGWLLVALGVLALLANALVLLAWRGRREGQALVKRVMRLPLRAKLRLAFGLMGDGRVPWVARLLLPALVLYLASPLDIIPDFIPVIGYLDDALVMLAGVSLFLRLTPRDVLEEHLSALEEKSRAGSRRADADGGEPDRKALPASPEEQPEAGPEGDGGRR